MQSNGLERSIKRTPNLSPLSQIFQSILTDNVVHYNLS